MSDNPIEQAFTDVHFAEPESPDFVIAETLPVGLTVMGGPPKKSFKSLQAILYATLCARWPCTALPKWMKAIHTGPTLAWSYEASAGVINHILTKDLQIETTPGALYIAHNAFKFQLDNDDQANQMLDYMYEKEPILTVMDPFRNMHSEDENDSATITRLLSPMVQYAHETHSAVLLIHHVNKPSEGKDKTSFYHMRGSSALQGLADGLLTVEDTKVEGNIIINATFKRGLSYRRTIHLGVPGFGWGKVGYEVLDKETEKVRDEYLKGNTHTPSIAASTKLSIQQVMEVLETLRRNLIIPRSPPEKHWDRNNVP